MKDAEIGAYGIYEFTEPLTKIETVGWMVEVKSKSSALPTMITWYGILQSFGNIEGYLHDELDFENPENGRISFLGNVSEKTAYIRCGAT